METEGESRIWEGRTYVWHEDGSSGRGWYLVTYLWGDGEGVNEFFSNFSFDPSEGATPSDLAVGSSTVGAAARKSSSFTTPPLRQTGQAACTVAAMRNVLALLGKLVPSEPDLAKIMANGAKVDVSVFTNDPFDKSVQAGLKSGLQSLNAYNAVLNPLGFQVENPSGFTLNGFSAAIRSGLPMIVGTSVFVLDPDGISQVMGHAFVLQYNSKTDMVDFINPGASSETDNNVARTGSYSINDAFQNFGLPTPSQFEPNGYTNKFYVITPTPKS